MRLLRLDLERYGALEGCSLAFRPDARLHVVYGPNEAGKTSALAAVSDLLFGFEARASFAFRHAPKDLRLGGTLRSAAGEDVAFRRRRGNKGTLVDAADVALRDDLLAPFLGGLTRDIFGRAFGLGAAALREGANDLLAADGEAGASLFAASSGLRGLDLFRAGLDADAEAIFTPQARTKPFNELLRRHEAARLAVREKELKAGDWTELNRRLSQLDALVEDLGGRLTAVRSERARLERLGRAAPGAAMVEEAAARLAAFEDAPELSPEAAQLIAELLDAFEAAHQEAARAGVAFADAERMVAAVAVDEAALGARADIERLVEQSGAYGKNRADLPRVQAEADSFAADLEQLAARLGLADGEAVEHALPTDAARAAIRELIGEGRALVEGDRLRDRTLAAERERMTRLAGERAERPEARDPRPLREAFAALAPELKRLDRRSERAAEHAAEARALTSAAARLAPPVEALERLATASTPSPEAIARARKRHEAADAEIDRLTRTLADADEAAAQAEVDLAAIEAGRPIASPEAIGAARAARDAAWRALRAHVLEARILPPIDRHDAIEAFERHAPEADRLADRATEDASRVAVQADLVRRRAEVERRRESVSRALAAARDARDAALGQWEEAWAPVGIKPLGAAEMAAWLMTIGLLIERLEKNALVRAEIVALEAAERKLEPRLARLAADAGLGALDGLDALALAARIEARIAALGDGWDHASRLDTKIAETGRRVAELEAEASDAAMAWERWRARWAVVAPAIGVARDVTIAAADAALAAWSHAPALLKERDDRLRRVRGMERDAEAFRSEVGRLVAAVAPELSELTPDAAARRLQERLTTALQQETRLKEASLRKRQAELALAETSRASEVSAAALREASAGLPEGVELRGLLARVAERALVQAELATTRRHLLALGEQGDEATLRAELAAFDPDAAAAALAGLKEEEARLGAQEKDAFAERDRELRRRGALEGGVGAELAAGEQRAAEAELAATAREWAVLKLAALLVGEAISRHRAARQDPLVARAGALFSTLTGGTFKGFVEDYEDDEPRLMGERANDERVPVSGLSEGTRDQFYLALRLAFLEDYAARAEPAPFIGDDLFSSFDDARTAHGLTALAGVGATVQPILFTHHRSVVEIARKTLGDAVDVVEFTR